METTWHMTFRGDVDPDEVDRGLSVSHKTGTPTLAELTRPKCPQK